MNTASNPKRPTPEHGALYAAQMIREALMMLIEHDGLTWDEAIAGAHAEVISAMVMGYGGQIAAARCASAAERIAHLPSAAAAQAGMMHGTPEGRC